MAKRHPTTIRGIVLPAGWEKNGVISAVDIAGYDEKTYRVVNDQIGNQLMTCVKKRIVADGIVMTHRGRLAIKVNHFRVDTVEPAKPIA
jgi:hypothetical protein